MLKDCIILRSLNVKYRGGIGGFPAKVLEQLFQPDAPMRPMMPPIYGACAGLISSGGISALKNRERLFFSMPMSVAPNLETRKPEFQARG
jgi:hypothetical protein